MSTEKLNQTHKSCKWLEALSDAETMLANARTKVEELERTVAVIRSFIRDNQPWPGETRFMLQGTAEYNASVQEENQSEEQQHAI